MILGYDRIIMMGHGSSDGLLAVDQFDTDSSHIIDDSFIDVLKRKLNIYGVMLTNSFVNLI